MSNITVKTPQLESFALWINLSEKLSDDQKCTLIDIISETIGIENEIRAKYSDGDLLAVHSAFTKLRTFIYLMT